MTIGFCKAYKFPEIVTFCHISRSLRTSHKDSGREIWTFYLLAKHPQVAEKLQAELDGVLQTSPTNPAELAANLKYMEQVVKEVLRLYHSFSLTVRDG